MILLKKFNNNRYKMYDTIAYGKKSKNGKFEKLTVKRGECGPDGVEFDVKYCG